MRETSWLLEWLCSSEEGRFSADLTFQFSFSRFRYDSFSSTVYRVNFSCVFSWRYFRPVDSDSVAAIALDSPRTATSSATTDALTFWVKQVGLLLRRQCGLDLVLPSGPVFAHGTTGAKRTVGAPPSQYIKICKKKSTLCNIVTTSLLN
jgi:hypothetical protein